MKKRVLLTIIFSVSLNAFCFNIGTNTFEFVFEDTGIPNDKKLQIVTDFTDIITRCNLAIVNYITPTNGVITYKKLHIEPYPSRKIPRNFIQVNETNYLSVSKIVSDELQQRLAIHNTYTNAYSTCTNFVNFLNSDDLQNISSNHIKNVFYQKGVNDAIYMSYREDFINDLSGIQFFYPPKSSFYIMEAGFNGVVQETVWAFIPYRTRSKRLNCYIAVFFNNYWHLISPYDPILEEFLEKAKEKVQNSISNDN
jgi:hypothetical protein